MNSNRSSPSSGSRAWNLKLLPLVTPKSRVLVEELHGVLNGNDVLRHRPVDQVDHGRKGGRLATARGARDQNYAPLLARQHTYDLRQTEILELRHPKRDEAHGDQERTSLPERVDPETPYPTHRVGEVRLPVLLELLKPLLRHDVPREILGIYQ